MVGVFRSYEALHTHLQHVRDFWFFDSFEGFRPQGLDEGLDSYLQSNNYAAPLEIVKHSFSKFGLLDKHVHFVKGYFEDTMPGFMPPSPISLLRLDGDLYTSTQVVLEHLYPFIQNGGWVVVDDYNWHPAVAKVST